MIGVLLLNTGTPENADRKSVAKYLRQFLMDPRVVDLPLWIRWPLVNLLIIPTRAVFSARAYQSIWTSKGSPLLVFSQELKEKLSEKLGENYCVELGMRYGQPDIIAGLEKLRHCSQIKLLPLFPQYASASSGSVIEKCLETLKIQKQIPPLSILPPFYDDEGFINAYAHIIERELQNIFPDFILFSYHGLPERQNIQINPTYSEQCYITSQKLAEALNLSPEKYGTSFQSRLGKTPWIQPYTDEYLVTLREKGIKSLFIACPAFTIDCLETLEEIGMRLKEQWMTLGGEGFYLSRCLNSEDEWVAWLASGV